MDDKIQTLHPDPDKQGVRISKQKYDQVRAAILEVMQTRAPLTYSELAAAVNEALQGKFEGSIPWYATTVKLDLEARNVIERIPKTRPPQLRLTST